MTTATIELPPKLVPVFAPQRGALRYRGAHGGRGSGKSFSFAKMAAVFGYAEPLRILCTRELQVSIKESFHTEVKNAIESTPWLAAAYEVGESYVRGRNGTEFIFRGLRHNMTAIKSMAQIDLCIVEEAEDVPEASWRDLLPTVRAAGSEVWVVWNPRDPGSPVDRRFRQREPEGSRIVEVNWQDNPFFTDALDRQRREDMEVLDPETYAHVWDGAYLEISDAQVLRGKWRLGEFSPGADWDGPYYGADWGFNDPTTLVRLWIHEKRLYVEHEAYGANVDLDDLPALFDTVPAAREHLIRADSARPETIAFMRRRGFKIAAAKKGTGSVEDGVAHLRGYREIVIHPRCRHAANEARLWSWKRNKAGDVLPVLVDAFNHCWDAARYALEPLIRQRGSGYAAAIRKSVA